MSKQDTSTLRQNAGTAQGTQNTLSQTAQTQNSILTPTLSRLAAGGGGYTPAQMGSMNTAALQATGGANAGTVGGAMQRAASTNNAGSSNALALASGHNATQNLSDAALGVQNQSAQLAAQQQGSALNELGSLYGTNTAGANSALGLSNQATGAAEQASQNGFWRGIGQKAVGNVFGGY